MLAWFRPVPVYVKVYPNAISITNLQTGETVHHTAPGAFSNSHMVMASFGIAEKPGREILRELRLSRRPLKTRVQQMQVYEGVLSEVENRILRTLCGQIGSRSVFLNTTGKELFNKEALKILCEN